MRFVTPKIHSGNYGFYLTSRYNISVTLRGILTENVDSIDTRLIPITKYWAVETVIEQMCHTWRIGRERVKWKLSILK